MQLCVRLLPPPPDYFFNFLREKKDGRSKWCASTKGWLFGVLPTFCGFSVITNPPKRRSEGLAGLVHLPLCPRAGEVDSTGVVVVVVVVVVEAEV